MIARSKTYWVMAKLYRSALNQFIDFSHVDLFDQDNRGSATLPSACGALHTWKSLCLSRAREVHASFSFLGQDDFHVLGQ